MTQSDPFDGLADFNLCADKLLSQQHQVLMMAQRRAERVGDYEIALKVSREWLRPKPKATKDMLIGAIDGARQEIERVLEV